MQSIVNRPLILLVTLIIFLSFTVNVYADNGIKTAGDVLVGTLLLTGFGKSVSEDSCWGEARAKKDCGFFQFAGTEILTFGITFGLKSAIHEERPDHSDKQSFPSGHSSMAFSTAEFLRNRYGMEYGIPAYAAATFVAFSRVNAKKHHVHDVIAGAGIGVGTSLLVDKIFKGINAQVSADSKSFGVILTKTW